MSEVMSGLAAGFRVIDRSTWVREEYFHHFYTDVPCTYSMTVRLDVTQVLRHRLKLHRTLLFALATVVNRHDEFRMAVSPTGEVGVYDHLDPSYVVLNEESETFSNVWTAYTPDYAQFCASYEQDLREFGAAGGLVAKPNVPPHVFTVSMMPWVSFEGFNLNLRKGYEYLLPIFTLGKTETVGERVTLPLAVQVHHAVCDGFHVARFVQELQDLLDVGTS